MKHFAHSIWLSIAIAALSSTAALAATPDLTGQWVVEQTGYNGPTTGTISLTMTGTTFVANNAKTGTSFSGGYCQPGVKGCTSPLQVNGKWRDAKGGTGWLTVYVTPNGHSLNGSWGYNGRKENGTFVGNKVLPPIKITTAGNWTVAAVTGPTLFSGPMSCTQSGPTSVCTLGPGTLNGKFRTSDKVRYKWTSTSQNGWFSFWFNDDGQSFNGIWGYGPDTTPVMGRVVGQRQGPPARM